MIIERPGWYQVITPSASGSRNEVAFSQLEDSHADQVIDETVAAYRAHGIPFRWSVGFWTKPDDFGERLARRGFTATDVRGMGCDSSLPLPFPARITVEAVTEHNVDDYVTCMLCGWSQPLEERDLERHVLLAEFGTVPRNAFCFVARIDGTAVGTAALVLRGDYGYLLGTQVLEAARGQGVYRALVAARLSFLSGRSITYAVTQAREATSAPMLEHLGFETLFRSTSYVVY